MSKKEDFLALEEIFAPGNPEIKQLALYDEQVFQFFEDNLGEFGASTIQELLKSFGFHGEELYVLYSNRKPGLAALQVPLSQNPNSFLNASATLTWFMDDSSKKVLAISGIKRDGLSYNHILTARYEASPYDESYELVRCEKGMKEPSFEGKKLPGIDEKPFTAVITNYMRRATKNRYKINGLGDFSKIKLLDAIPYRLPIK